MKAVMGLMEYIVLTFFIILVLVVIVFFLVGYQISQFNAQKQETKITHGLQLSEFLSSSPFLVKEPGVFDAGKLTALRTLGNGCESLERIFGKGWFITISLVNQPELVCDQTTFPACSSWEFCTKDAKSLAYDFPTNVYIPDPVVPRIVLAEMKVGVYVD